MYKVGGFGGSNLPSSLAILGSPGQREKGSARQILTRNSNTPNTH